MSEGTSNGKTIGISATVAGGLITVFGSVLWGNIDAAKTAAGVALEVARDHGTELETIRQRHGAITMQLSDLRAQLSLGRRFTAEDGEKIGIRIDRLSSRLDRLDDRIRYGNSSPQE